jgi:hypothetical protein
MTREEMLNLICEITQDNAYDLTTIESVYNIDLSNLDTHTDEELGLLIDAWADFGDGFEV